MIEESDNKNYEALEQAIELSNKKRNVDFYHVAKHVALKHNMGSNFVGYIERQVAEWLSQNPDLIEEVKSENLSISNVVSELYSNNAKEIDKCAVEIMNIFKTEFKMDLDDKVPTWSVPFDILNLSCNLNLCVNNELNFDTFLRFILRDGHGSSQFGLTRILEEKKKYLFGRLVTECQPILSKLRCLCFKIFKNLEIRSNGIGSSEMEEKNLFIMINDKL